MAIQQEADILLEQRGITTSAEREAYRRQKALLYRRQQAGASTEGRVIATRTENLKLIEQRLAFLIPDALAASDALPRGRVVAMNKLVQAYQAGTSDPRLSALAIANLNLADTWALSQKPTGVLDVSLRGQALDKLNITTDRRAYATAVNQMVREIVRNYQAAKNEEAGIEPPIPAVPGAYVPPGQAPLPGQPTPSAPEEPGPIGSYEEWVRQHAR